MEGDKNPTLYDYLRQFHSVYETGILTDKAVVLYWQMVSMFNACGWKQWVGVDTARLMAMIHETNKTTAYRARDKLVHAGLIAYQKGRKGKPSVYGLRYGGANEAFFSYNSVTENVSENVTENVTENATHNKTKDLRLKTGEYPPNPPAGGTGSSAQVPVENAPSPAPEEPSKPKRGTRQKDPSRSPELTPDEETMLMGYSPGLCAAVRDWFQYKAERREMYGATFRRTFFGKIAENVQEYGADAVAKHITDCLSKGWKGVEWDDLAKKSRKNGGGYGREGGRYANGNGGYVAGGNVGAETGGRAVSADERWGID